MLLLHDSGHVDESGMLYAPIEALQRTATKHNAASYCKYSSAFLTPHVEVCEFVDGTALM